MARPNPRLRNLMREAIIQHFTSTHRGMYYEELASSLGVSIPKVTPELDFLGDEDIENGRPPMDALVIRKDTGIPASEHFIHRADDLAGRTQRDYYLSTITQLARNLNVTLSEDWIARVHHSLQ